MVQNSLHVNLLLTGIISRLAHYSQPLLRSLLLNHSLVLETNVKSLFQVDLQIFFEILIVPFYYLSRFFQILNQNSKQFPKRIIILTIWFN